MDYSTLYYIDEHGSKKAFRASTESGANCEPFLLLGHEIQPTEAIRFDYHDSGGAMVYDLVWTAWLLPLLSSRGLTTLRQLDMTGWTTYPVDLYDKNGRRIPDFHGLAVTGRCGPIDRSRSRRVQRAPLAPGAPPPHYWVGLFFKDDRWDGSDIFLSEGTGYIFVTERAKNALETLNIPNTEFEKLDTHETLI